MRVTGDDAPAPDAGHQYLCLEPVVLPYLHQVFDNLHPPLADVVKTADEGAEV